MDAQNAQATRINPTAVNTIEPLISERSIRLAIAL